MSGWGDIRFVRSNLVGSDTFYQPRYRRPARNDRGSLARPIALVRRTRFERFQYAIVRLVFCLVIGRASL